MANPLLRRYGVAVPSASTQTRVVGGSGVPANRALAVSKLAISRIGATASVSVSVSIGAAGGSPNNVINNLPLAVGEQWTETGLTVLAGEDVWIWCDTAAQLNVVLCGEEVDNT